ncbi:SdrD B-like domain-containing protein [Microbacterium sp. JZ37]|uniref:SdrD B-like domain-containing protein n=1 Tax=Microbacterium sp. JZ37 TaxID=2654193 RepID=UPI002B475F51|nr:SdrD B-like domain-containing protein [Microbacterium sp. JZ37]WRH16100.1 hypothetical protein GC092_00245 [Microbacterium sp. JZ37]
MPRLQRRSEQRVLSGSSGGARRWIASASIAGLIATGFVSVAAPAAAATGDEITGTIWQDYDANGVFDTYEDGIAGIEVYAYDDAGNSAGPAVTAADGTYVLPVTSDAQRWRVEANVPDTQQWEAWEDAVVGRAGDTTNGTTVQFVDIADAGAVDFSFHVPGAFVENNPRVYLPKIQYAGSDGPNADKEGGQIIWYDAESASASSEVPTTVNVPFRDVGATNGSTWRRATSPDQVGELFTAAYMRRHSGLGPEGLGAIYRVTPDGGTLDSATGSGSLFVDLTDHGIDVGAEYDQGALPGPDGIRPRVAIDNPAYDWSMDAQAWARVGRTGLGGIAMSPDETQMFAVNLFKRSLVVIDMGEPGQPPVNVREIELDGYFPDGSDLRPFGVSSDPMTNTMYITATNTAESTKNNADLHGYVYAFDPANPAALTQVLDFPLDFPRYGDTPQSPGDYQFWTTDSGDFENFARRPTPIVADARVQHGNLVVGVRDLHGDLIGYQTAVSPTDRRLATIRSVGDVYMATGNGDGTFTMESNGFADGVQGDGATAPLYQQPAGLLGPGGHKYFDDAWQIDGFQPGQFTGQALGSIITVPSRDDGVLTTGIHVANSGFQVGVRRLYQETGAHYDPRGAMVTQLTPVAGVPDATMKGNGLGTMSALASAAPIEIGNYVWYDTDRDGIQDPSEDPVEGATVNLYEVGADGARTLVSSTLTDARGEYYFSSNPDLNTNGYALKTNADYVVGIDNPADYAEGGPLLGWYPTVENTGDADSVDADRNDSDGIVEVSDAGHFPFAAVTTGGPGQNDHTIDFGYAQLDYTLEKRTVSGPTENPDEDGTWTIEYDLVVENPSLSPGEYGLEDDLRGYGEGIEVVGTEVVSGPEGAVLNEDWDGVESRSVLAERFPIAAESIGDDAHVYRLAVTVRLAADAETGEATVDPAQLGCTDGQTPADATTGLFNTATLDPLNHEDLVDDECGELPLVELDKTIVSEPTVVDRDNEPGVWEVVYGLEVRSLTGADTDYDLVDELRYGSAVEVLSVEAENVDPGDIAVRDAFDGLTDHVIVTDEPIAGGATHRYEVTVRYTFTLPNPPADPNPSDCSLAGSGESGTGLLNTAQTEFNGYPSPDDECRELGQVTHEKELISANPIGDGRWQADYRITVSNKGVEKTLYDLDDTLRYADEVDVVSAEVTGAPEGVTLADPAWDGEENTRVASLVPILGTDDEGYAPHEYTLRVISDVPLAFEGAGTEDDPTVCADGTVRPGGSALSNTSTLTDEAGVTEDDEACAPLPSIDIDKSISAGPVPNGDGTWTVTYDIVATNDGAAEGVYEVSDRMTEMGDLRVLSREVVETPEGVTAQEGWTGLGEEGSAENVIASDVPLAAGGVHTYRIEVLVELDESLGGLAEVACSEFDEDGAAGLVNSAGIGHNDLADADDACVTVAQITIDKSISEGPVPNGDGTWTIVYDLVAENLGEVSGEYDIFDRLRFGEGIEIVESEVEEAPDGVTALESWTGLGDEGAAENLIAEDVTLEGQSSHTYRVAVTVALDESSVDPNALACPEPGTGGSGGLNNAAALLHNGIESTDEECASLPLFTFDKTLAEGPVANGDGTWTIVYGLEVANVGQAAGDYDLDDSLRYGDGIVVESSDVVATPEGVEDPAGWTGRGADGDDENRIATAIPLDAGAAHSYRVAVTVSLDLETVTPDALACPAPGSGENGGLNNVAGMTHNGETQEDDVCAPLPLIEIEKSLSGAVTPVEGQPGQYDATYEIAVTNSGPAAGAYDLDDEWVAGNGLTVLGVQDISTDAPDSVGINPGFGTDGDTRIVTGQPIAAAPEGGSTVHTYTVVLRYALDLAEVQTPAADTCDAGDRSVPDGALRNDATVNWNGISDEDDACVLSGKPTLDKELTSATPVGEGQWEVVYDLTVGNTGNEPTRYDLDDEFLFAPVVTVDEVSVTGPEGVEIEGSFDGAENQRIATGVEIAGLDDEGYAPHVYRVTVLVDVPLHFAEAEQDGTGAPGCTAPEGGNFLEQGLNNAATLTDETGGEITDTDCAPLPSIDIAKEIVGSPTVDEDGVWTVEYEIVAVNDGAEAGVYDLSDRLRFGAGIEVQTAEIAEAPEGVTPNEAWTGQGEEGADENVVASDVALGAGSEHTYRVVVTATLDAEATDESTFACPAPGEDGTGGFANTAGIVHNDLTDTAEACDVPNEPGQPNEPNEPNEPGQPNEPNEPNEPGQPNEPNEPGNPPAPQDPLSPTGVAIGVGVLGAALLLTLAGGILLYLRRRPSGIER